MLNILYNANLYNYKHKTSGNQIKKDKEGAVANQRILPVI